MKLFRKTKGAISIFLVLILVPMMTISSAFVDASKVELARSVAQSAGDLALNTALTNYDSKLKELYGLMATAQDTTDLFNKLEDYYRTCITSSGVSAEDADLYVAQYINALKGVSESQDVADLMNMELVDFSVEKLSGADLANATVLKKQIVEFMKYRSPINTGLSFVSSLESFSTLSKQSELIEKKQAYYEAEQTMLEDLQKAWSYIAKYNGNKIVTDAGYIVTIANTMNDYQNEYVDFGKRTMKTLYEKEDLLVTYQYTCTLKEVEVTKYDIKDGRLEETVTVWRITYNGETTKSYWDTNYSNPYNYKSKKFPTATDLGNAIESFYNSYQLIDQYTNPYYESSTDYIAQFFAQNKDEIVDYTNKLIRFYTAYQNLQNVLLWLDAYDKVVVEDEDENRITKESILSQNLKIGKHTKTMQAWMDELDPEQKYNLKMNDAEKNFHSYNDWARKAAEEYRAVYDPSKSVDINQEIGDYQKVIDGYIKELETAVTDLDAAITYLGYARTKLTGTVATAKGNWNKIATDKDIKDTTLAKQDKSEIETLDDYLNEESIDSLVNRLNNIKGKISDVIKEIKAYQYAGKSIYEIKSYADFETVLGNKWSDLKSLSIKETALNDTVNNRASGAWKAGSIPTKWVGQSGTQPNLLMDKVKLYTYLSAKFGNTPPASDTTTQQAPSTENATEDSENGKQFYSDIKTTAKNEADKKSGQTGGGQIITETDKDKKVTGNNLPSKISNADGGSEITVGTINTNVDAEGEEKGAAGKSASGLSALFNTKFLDAIAEMGNDLLEKLYVADYIVSMFSYDTIENEYKVENNVDEVKPGDILSLTKNDISAQYNYAYGAEVEYIIFGNADISENVTSAYATIYGIRFGFNVIYAFATSEIRDSALAIATPISAATLGIIPVPLIQAVIIVAVACCESALDLVNLQNGEKVMLYKTSETWTCSITGLLKTAKKVTVDFMKKGAEVVVNEGVKVLNDVLDMTSEEIDNLTSDQFDDISAAMTNMYDQLITENANAAIQYLTSLANAAAQNVMFKEGTEGGKDLESCKNEMKQWVVNELQIWANQYPGDDLASTVKREAVKVIIQNSDTCIGGLIDAIINTTFKATGVDGDTVDGMLAGVTADPLEEVGGTIMEYISGIRREIQNAINSAETAISEKKEQLVTNIKDSIGEGADKLKDTINSNLDKVFGTGSDGAVAGNDSGVGMASIFAFSYSDYLRLFLMVGMYTGEGKILLRTADLIQLNMRQAGVSNFEMKNAAAYVKISATILVKPTLLALPIFADVQTNPIDNTGWYTITYSGISGY